jgi:hypothetical protein
MKLITAVVLVIMGFSSGVLVGMHMRDEPKAGVIHRGAGPVAALAAFNTTSPASQVRVAQKRFGERVDYKPPSSPPATSPLKTEDGVMTLAPASSVLRHKLESIANSAARERPTGFENPVAAWQKRFDSDAPSSNWSAMTEAQLTSSVSNFGMTDVEVVGVSCKETICEIQAASTSGDNAQEAALEWQSMMSTISNANWWTTFSLGEPNTAILGGDDGRSLIISYISRAQQS